MRFVLVYRGGDVPEEQREANTAALYEWVDDLKARPEHRRTVVFGHVTAQTRAGSDQEPAGLFGFSEVACDDEAAARARAGMAGVRVGRRHRGVRRRGGAMTTAWSDVRPYFDRAAVAHVATLMPDGAPHSVPVWVGVEGDELAFFTIAGSRKDTNIAADPRVAISVTNPDDPFDMAFVRGRVTRRVDGDAAWRIVDRLSLAYTGEPYQRGITPAAFLVTPERPWAQDYSG